MFSHHKKEGVKSNMTCALKVDTNSKGWSENMTKILKKINGLSYNFDTKEGMIYISGKVDSKKIIKMAGKHGKKVELCWINSMEGNNYANTNMDMPMSSSSSSSAYPQYQGGYYPPPPPPPPPMPYYQYNNYDPMYAPHYDPMYQQHGYSSQLPYY